MDKAHQLLQFLCLWDLYRSSTLLVDTIYKYTNSDVPSINPSKRNSCEPAGGGSYLHGLCKESKLLPWIFSSKRSEPVSTIYKGTTSDKSHPSTGCFNPFINNGWTLLGMANRAPHSSHLGGCSSCLFWQVMREKKDENKQTNKQTTALKFSINVTSR